MPGNPGGNPLCGLTFYGSCIFLCEKSQFPQQQNGDNLCHLVMKIKLEITLDCIDDQHYANWWYHSGQLNSYNSYKNIPWKLRLN